MALFKRAEIYYTSFNLRKKCVYAHLGFMRYGRTPLWICPSGHKALNVMIPEKLWTKIVSRCSLCQIHHKKYVMDKC